MTDTLAREAAMWVAAAMGHGWYVADGNIPSNYKFLNGGKNSRIRCRIEYKCDDFVYIAFQGESWLEVLDNFFEDMKEKITPWQRTVLEKLGDAASAEELVLKMAVSGENQASPCA